MQREEASAQCTHAYISVIIDITCSSLDRKIQCYHFQKRTALVKGTDITDLTRAGFTILEKKGPKKLEFVNWDCKTSHALKSILRIP